MKIFKYQLSRLIKILLYVCIAICIAAFTVNLYFAITFRPGSVDNPAYNIIQYALFFIVTVALAVISVSILMSSSYRISEDKLTLKFGIIRSSYKIADIELLNLDRTTDKLSVHFKNGEYMLVVVKGIMYDDFINALLAVNPQIEYSVCSETKEPDADDKNMKN